MASGAYIERDEALIRRPLNKTFEELLAMSGIRVSALGNAHAEKVARLWRDEGVPPLLALRSKISRLSSVRWRVYDVSHLLVTDELTADRTACWPTAKLVQRAAPFFLIWERRRISQTSQERDTANGICSPIQALLNIFSERHSAISNEMVFIAYSRPSAAFFLDQDANGSNISITRKIGANAKGMTFGWSL